MDWSSPYVLFNVVEGIIWVSLGILLLTRVRTFPSDQRWIIRTAAVALWLFGISDWLEAPTGGHLSLPIWALKLSVGATLVFLWYRYAGIDRDKWIDSRSLLMLIVLLIVWALIGWTWWTTAATV